MPQRKSLRDPTSPAAAKRFRHYWIDAQYDGIRGSLPDWLPAADRSRFENLQRSLFWQSYRGAFTFKELKALFRAEFNERERSRRETSDTPVVVYVTVPRNQNLVARLDDIADLVTIFEAVAAGPMATLPERIGSMAIAEIETQRQRQRAQSPRQPRGLRKIILDFLRKKPSSTLQDLLRELRNPVHHEVISQVRDDGIEFVDGKGMIQDLNMEALRRRFYRAKK